MSPFFPYVSYIFPVFLSVFLSFFLFTSVYLYLVVSVCFFGAKKLYGSEFSILTSVSWRNIYMYKLGVDICVCLKCIFDKLAYLMLGMEPMSNFLDIQSILSLFLGLGYEGQCLFKDDGAYCELSSCRWWVHMELLLTDIIILSLYV